MLCSTADYASMIAVKDVVEKAFLNGDDAVNDDLYRRSFRNVVPLFKTSPERIESIRARGCERAVPASGSPIGLQSDKAPVRRAVLLG